MSRSGKIGRAFLVIALVVAVVLTGRAAGRLVPEFAARIERLGALGPAAFVAGYAVATVAFIPASLLTLAAGALFGLVKGVMLAFAGALLGASAAFLISRHLARASIERRIEGNARFSAIDRAVSHDGRRIVFLLRLSPAFPFGLLNYALGLTQVRFADYLVASVGMLPGTVLYVYYGKLAGDVATLAAGAGAHRDAGYYAVLGVGLVATVVVTTLVTRTARRALAAAAV